jgi:hypothetical protein
LVSLYESSLSITDSTSQLVYFCHKKETYCTIDN